MNQKRQDKKGGLSTLTETKEQQNGSLLLEKAENRRNKQRRMRKRNRKRKQLEIKKTVEEEDLKE